MAAENIYKDGRLGLKLTPDDIREKMRQGQTHGGSQYIPAEFLDLANFHYRFINFDKNNISGAREAVAMGYMDLDPEEAQRIRDGMGFGIFNQNSKGAGSTVEIPYGEITARLMKMPLELYNVILEEKEREFIEEQKSATGKLQTSNGIAIPNVSVTADIQTILI